MQQLASKFPLDRRRPGTIEKSYAAIGRREGDFARMKLQHWIELADVALRDDRPSFQREDSDPSTEPTAA